MAIDRTTVAKGPAIVMLGSRVYHDKDGINSELVTSWERPASSQFGELSPRKVDQMGKTTFTPVGVVTADMLTELFPAAFTSPSIGASIFGAADAICTVHAKSGTKVVWGNSALTTMPELALGANKTVFGPCEITHLLKNNTERSAANSLVGPISEAVFADPGFDESAIKMVRYVGNWGDLADLQAKDGWTISFDLQLEPEVSADYGTIDFTLKLVRVTAKCRPYGLGEEAILSNLSLDAEIGALPSNSSDLTIVGAGGLTVVLKNASLVEGPLVYKDTELRAGELLFEASANVADGGELFSVQLT